MLEIDGKPVHVIENRLYRDIVGIDWAGVRPLAAYTEIEGEPMALEFPSWVELGAWLRRTFPKGVLVVAESSFGSFLPDEATQAITILNAAGAVVRTVSSRTVARVRQEQGLEKSDAIDARIIWELAEGNKYHLKTPHGMSAVEPEWEERCREANDELMRLRRDGTKDAYALSVLAHAGIPEKEPNGLAPLVKKNGRISLVVVAAVGKAIEHTTSRQEFERMLGLYAHGYPSQLRSDIHHWGFRFQRDRWTFRQYRRAIRNLRRRILVVDNPQFPKR